MTDQPQSGGRYTRDPETGALTRRTDQAPAKPADGTAPATTKSSKSSKGGK